jgi:hypothetical protein
MGWDGVVHGGSQCMNVVVSLSPPSPTVPTSSLVSAPSLNLWVRVRIASRMGIREMLVKRTPCLTYINCGKSNILPLPVPTFSHFLLFSPHVISSVNSTSLSQLLVSGSPSPSQSLTSTPSVSTPYPQFSPFALAIPHLISSWMLVNMIGISPN